jgi:hypothetical protein
MALYYDLPVFNELCKFTLGQDMKRECLQLVRSIHRANMAKTKDEYLEQFLDDFEVPKLLA